MEESGGFVEELNRDAELKRALRLQRVTEDVFDILLEEEIREQISKEEGIEKNISVKLPGFSNILLIAGCLLIPIFSSAIWYANMYNSNASLVGDFFRPQNLSLTRGENDQISSIDDASVYFIQGKYESCIRLLSGLKEIDPHYEEGRHMLGCAYLKMGESHSAIQIFSDLKKLDGERNDRTDWYLTLSHLQANDLGKAKDSLYKILDNPEHPYSLSYPSN